MRTVTFSILLLYHPGCFQRLQHKPDCGAPRLRLAVLRQVAREFRAVWVATVVNIDWPSRPGLYDRMRSNRKPGAFLTPRFPSA